MKQSKRNIDRRRFMIKMVNLLRNSEGYEIEFDTEAIVFLYMSGNGCEEDLIDNTILASDGEDVKPELDLVYGIIAMKWASESPLIMREMCYSFLVRLRPEEQTDFDTIKEILTSIDFNESIRAIRLKKTPK